MAQATHLLSAPPSRRNFALNLGAGGLAAITAATPWHVARAAGEADAELIFLWRKYLWHETACEAACAAFAHVEEVVCHVRPERPKNDLFILCSGEGENEYLERCRQLRDDFEAQLFAIEAAHGLPELEQAQDLHIDQVDELAETILKEPARGLTGVLIKLKVWRKQTTRFDREEPPGRIVLSVIDDLERLTDGVQLEAAR